MKCERHEFQCEECLGKIEPKVIQILPASSTYAAYYDDEKDEINTDQVGYICLYNNGDIRLQSVDYTGWISDPTEVDNFLGFFFNLNDMPKEYFEKVIIEKKFRKKSNEPSPR